MGDYVYLRAWLRGELEQSLGEFVAQVEANPPVWLDERARRAYATALLWVAMTGEHRLLWATVEDKDTRTDEVCALYEEVEERVYSVPGGWCQKLLELGRTRTAGFDAEWIAKGQPERGQYYWY